MQSTIVVKAPTGRPPPGGLPGTPGTDEGKKSVPIVNSEWLLDSRQEYDSAPQADFGFAPSLPSSARECQAAESDRCTLIRTPPLFIFKISRQLQNGFFNWF
jgi:hypothetical protein